MTTIKAMIRDGRLDVRAPDELPEGTEVYVDVSPIPMGKIGLTEAEWSDDEAALADWGAWLRSIEPVAFANEDAFDAEFRRFNLEAVRRQMAAGEIP